MATHENKVDPQLTERQVQKAKSRCAEKVTKALKREYAIGAGEVKASSQEVTALKNFLGRYIPQKTDTQVTEVQSPPRKDDLMAQLHELINQSPEIAEELRKALNKKPDLKVYDGQA